MFLYPVKKYNFEQDFFYILWQLYMIKTFDYFCYSKFGE